MNADLKNILDRKTAWPEEDQEELAQIALEIEARRHGPYHATPEELAAIDEAPPRHNIQMLQSSGCGLRDSPRNVV
jgi:hypothetical protein